MGGERGAEASGGEGAEPADDVIAADAAGDEAGAGEQPAESRPGDRDDDDPGPAAGEWTAPAVSAPGAATGRDTEEWAIEDAEDGGADPGPADERPAAEGAPAGGDAPAAGESGAGPADEPDAAGGAGEPSAEAVEHTVVRRRPPPPVSAAAYGESEEAPEIKTPALWWRFLMASVLIVVSVATAVSVSSLLLLTDVAAKLKPIPGLQERLASLDPGDPQTILIIGSDKRTNIEGTPADRTRRCSSASIRTSRSCRCSRCRATSRSRSPATARASSTMPMPTAASRRPCRRSRT